LQQVARLAARGLCEYCIVDLVEKKSIRRIEIAHADASRMDRLRAFAESFVAKPDGRLERMLTTGEPELVSEIRRRATSSSNVRRASPFEPTTGVRASLGTIELDFWESFVPVSYVAVPIKVGREIVAIMTVAASRTPLRFDEDRLAFATEIAGWCGLALHAPQSPHAMAGNDRSPGKSFTEPLASGRQRAKEAG
jgi:GAF domain-containing protein